MPDCEENAGLVALVPVIRPDGRVYRPRKVIAYPVADADEMTSGVMVLGTHDIERARMLADQCAAAWADGGYVATEPETGWFREGYEAGRPMWLRNERKGRAGVFFREITECTSGAVSGRTSHWSEDEEEWHGDPG
jgi:hypothetical protein